MLVEAGLLLTGDCEVLLGGSLVEAGLVLAELGALSEGFVLDDGLVLAGGSLWEGLVEAEGVTLGAFDVSDGSAEVLGGDEVGPLLGVVLCRVNNETFSVWKYLHNTLAVVARGLDGRWAC